MNNSTKAGDLTLLFLRAGIGLMLFAYHGWGKLKGAAAYVFSGADWGLPGVVAADGLPFPGLLAVCAALAESIAALFLAAGLWTRYAAALVAFNMAVAVYHHMRSDWNVEFALLYFLPALLFVFLAPGRFSLDALIGGRRGGGKK